MPRREFSRGTNAQAATLGERGPFQVSCILKAGEDESDPSSVYEFDEFDPATLRRTVKRPTADSLTNAEVYFSPQHIVDAEEEFKAGLCDGGERWAAFDAESGTPSVGDDVGTVTDSYKLALDQTGFKVLHYDATGERVRVRPFSSGGGPVRYLVDAPDLYLGLTPPVRGGRQVAFFYDIPEDERPTVAVNDQIICGSFGGVPVMSGNANVENVNSTRNATVTLTLDLRYTFEDDTTRISQPIRGKASSTSLVTGHRLQVTEVKSDATPPKDIGSFTNPTAPSKIKKIETLYSLSITDEFVDPFSLSVASRYDYIDVIPTGYRTA